MKAKVSNQRINVECQDSKCILSNKAGQVMADVAVAPAGKLSAPKQDKSPELDSFFGQGERLCWQAKVQDGLTGEIWLSAHELQDFILIGGELENTSDKPVYVDDLCLCEIVISRDDIESGRLFVNGAGIRCRYNRRARGLESCPRCRRENERPGASHPPSTGLFTHRPMVGNQIREIKRRNPMNPLFEIKDVDTKCYEEQLRDFLPEKIIDIHTHVWLDKHRSRKGDRRRIATWPDRVAKDNSIDDLLETYRLMFPGKQVTPMFFPSVLSPKDDITPQNDYVRDCAAKHNLPALIWSLPTWGASELEEKIRAGKFLGLKSYLSHAPDYIPGPEIRIFDTFPHHHLEVLNKHGWIMMLHIPRPDRLKDPVNLAQMIEIEKKYPNIKLIIAHVGRAYCPEDVGNAFELLAETKTMMFDISANTCAETFEKLIRAVGPKRILFGSDLPIARMRMRRICEDGRYINLVPKGLYGDVSADKNMREIQDNQAEKLTFFMYEELKAFRRAAEKTELTREDIEDVFYNNAHQLITSVKPKPVQLQMIWPKGKLDKPPKWILPEGYSLRTYQPGDQAGYIRVMKLAGFESWNEKAIEGTLACTVPNGLFFLVHDETKKIVATAVACHRSHLRGELGWVAADPEHKGKALGYIVCAAVVKCFIDAGYTDIFLQTDDFRIPAIKTYLKLGFEPLFFAPDMEPRWQAVRKEIGI